jgi:hypothetical protein
MHSSPRKQLGGPRREKYAALEVAADEEIERRVYRGSQPKARKFPLRAEASREERSRQGPRG